MSFVSDNDKFEAWLRKQLQRQHCSVVEPDLTKKHERMRESAFIFLRATYFRWAKRIESICPDLAKTPPVLSVGDLHLENFGTWRDAEGRLVWGVNDFDEAAVIPYALDLVRLATSARLAANLPIGSRAIARALIDGYSDGLERPRPTLLDEQERWMRPYVVVTDHGRDKFWHDIEHMPDAESLQDTAKEALLSAGLPEGAKVKRYAKRVAGGGSLGRPRFVAIAEWNGGRIFREAKALVPSAWNWAHDDASTPSQFLDLANGPHRSPDPFLRVQDNFIVRRMAADARKLNLHDDANAVNSARMITAMGFDLGAIHAADSKARDKIRHDLDKARRGDEWLYDAARDAAEAVKADYEEWRQKEHH